MADLLEVPLDEAREIRVELEPARSCEERAQSGKPGANDLLGVVGQPRIGVPRERWTATVQERAKLTVGFVGPRSARAIGRMRRVAILPAPEWAGRSSGVADPVSR